MRVCVKCAQSLAGDWSCPACGFVPAAIEGILCFSPELDGSADFFDHSSYDELVRIEEGSFWFQARNRMIARVLRRFAAHAREILEVGCGTGFVLSEMCRVLPEARFCASDGHVRGLGFAMRRVPRPVEFLQFDALAVPFRDEFDVVCAFDVLEHIDDDRGALAELARALKPGGVMVLTVPQHPWLWGPADQYACHKRRYRVGELARKVHEAGLTVESATGFVWLLLPLMALNRMLERRRTGFDPLAEHQNASRLAGLLGVVMRIEEVLFALGLRLPVGGSQLLVARKPTADHG